MPTRRSSVGLAFVAALAVGGLLMPAAGWSQFDPTCGLSDGRVCGPDKPSSGKPKKKPKKRSQPRRRKPERPAKRGDRLSFRLSWGGPPTTGNRLMPPSYVLTLGRGDVTLRLGKRRGYSRRIEGAHGILRVSHQFQGFERKLTLLVYRGTSYTTSQRSYEGRREVVAISFGLQVRVLQSNDPGCPAGRRGVITVLNSASRSLSTELSSYLCGGDYSWAHDPAASRVVTVDRARARRG